jgi:hypothetical protein
MCGASDLAAWRLQVAAQGAKSDGNPAQEKADGKAAQK